MQPITRAKNSTSYIAHTMCRACAWIFFCPAPAIHVCLSKSTSILKPCNNKYVFYYKHFPCKSVQDTKRNCNNNLELYNQKLLSVINVLGFFCNFMISCIDPVAFKTSVLPSHISRQSIWFSIPRVNNFLFSLFLPFYPHSLVNSCCLCI